MNKYSLISHCAIGFLGLSATTIIMAHPPNNTIVQFQCPVTTGSGSNILTNFGTYIGGNGYEMINGNSTKPYQPEFDGPIIVSSNIPPNLNAGDYKNTGTSYTSSTGTVACHYASMIGFDPFNVAYRMTNGFGGHVINSTHNEIAISLSIGIKEDRKT